MGRAGFGQRLLTQRLNKMAQRHRSGVLVGAENRCGVVRSGKSGGTGALLRVNSMRIVALFAAAAAASAFNVNRVRGPGFVGPQGRIVAKPVTVCVHVSAAAIQPV